MLILHATQFSLIVIVYLWLKLFLDDIFAYALVPMCYGEKKIVGLNQCCDLDFSLCKNWVMLV
jgi:hypothetical protein